MDFSSATRLFHQFGQFLNRNNFHYYAIFGSGLIIALKLSSKWRNSGKRKRWDSAGKDVVLIHQFNRSKYTPSLSPFPIKLETYCRMAGIRYKIDSNDPLSSKGKTPWITINGKDIADSQLCIEYLDKKFTVDLNKHLKREEKAVSRSMRILLEDHAYWPVALWRWHFDKTNSLFRIWDSPTIVKLIKPLIGKSVRDASKGHGMGRHSEQEVYKMGIDDMRALSDFLGKKKFLMGEEPCEEDCTMFGMLVQIVWNLPGSPFETLINGEFSNLKDYVFRIKEKFWPDWDEAIKDETTDFTALKLH